MWDNDRNNPAREEDGPGVDNDDVNPAKQIMTTQQNLLTRISHLLCSLFYCCCGAKEGAISEDGTEKPQQQRQEGENGSTTSYSPDLHNNNNNNGSVSMSAVDEFRHDEHDHSNNNSTEQRVHVGSTNEETFYSNNNTEEEGEEEEESVNIEEAVSLQSAVDHLFIICMGKSTFTMAELEYLLQTYPEAAKSWRSTVENHYSVCDPDVEEFILPLHAACRKNAPISVIQTLLTAWPDAVWMWSSSFEHQRSDEGTLPLHEACRSAKSLATIQLLLKASPNMIRQGRYSRKEGILYPLHIALRNFAVSVDVIQYLVEQWPESLQVRLDNDDETGKLAMHYACEKGLSCSVIRFLVEQWPAAVREKSELSLPLHYACRQARSSSDTIAYLIDAWPDSIKVLDGHSRLPLHDACIHHAENPDVIKLLVDKWPDAAHVANPSDGCLPLHLACREKASLEVLQLLVQTWPSAVREKDNEGLLPLHYICEKKFVKGNPCLEKVQLLVESWPESPQIKTADGILPLHAACSYPQATSVVRYLVDSYPQAVRIQDRFRRLPLHNACKQCSRKVSLQQLETIAYLVDTWPESVQVPYSELFPVGCTGQLVLDLACDQCKLLSNEFIHLLTRGIPPLHFACANDCTSWIPHRWNTIQRLLSLYPNEMLQFHNGMLPIHLACRASAPRVVLECLVKQCPEVIDMVTLDTKDSLLDCYFASTQRRRTTTSNKLHQQQLHDWCWSTMMYLVELHPKALNCPNREGWLPLHIAAMHDAPLDMLYYLARRSPLL